mmetsp:Transcript_31846/g.51193  ORF Transcript_31846/g.51193 Transcript_31846/m.51193 type:complete len:241 (-) Transcript_31846:401-1123(-)
MRLLPSHRQTDSRRLVIGPTSCYTLRIDAADQCRTIADELAVSASHALSVSAQSSAAILRGDSRRFSLALCFAVALHLDLWCRHAWCDATTISCVCSSRVVDADSALVWMTNAVCSCCVDAALPDHHDDEDVNGLCVGWLVQLQVARVVVEHVWTLFALRLYRSHDVHYVHCIGDSGGDADRKRVLCRISLRWNAHWRSTHHSLAAAPFYVLPFGTLHGELVHEHDTVRLRDHCERDKDE